VPVPSLGFARTDEYRRTVSVVLRGLERVAELRGDRLLDVGCGNGLFTAHVGEGFRKVHGVDIQASNIGDFLDRGLPDKYSPHIMSSARLEFPSGFFDMIVSIETLEHVDDLDRTAAEISRVCRSGGRLVLTVPNRWFPFETHGGVVFGKRFGRLPLITYIPWLHSRFAEARVFTVSALDRLFVPLGFKRERLTYLWPTFEHKGNCLQRYLRWSLPLMRLMERGPLRFMGTSIVASYCKARPE
jgi:SAM-dependent methyltransferase